MLRPNVSYCIDNNEVHYNPMLPPETRVVGTFNVTSTSQPTWMTYGYEGETGWDNVSKVEVVKPSGTTIELAFSDLTRDQYQEEYGYVFDDTGIHTIYYTLTDPTFIGDDFANNFSSLTSITIPNSVTTIKGAFMGCSGLTSITIPNSVTTIENSFLQCSGLTSVTIPSSVIYLRGNSFQDCSNLTSVNIGNGLIYIDDMTFYNCSRLASATVEATTPPTMNGGSFGNNASGFKIYVPADSVAAYKAASGWSSYANDIEAIPAA